MSYKPWKQNLDTKFQHDANKYKPCQAQLSIQNDETYNQIVPKLGTKKSDTKFFSYRQLVANLHLPKSKRRIFNVPQTNSRLPINPVHIEGRDSTFLATFYPSSKRSVKKQKVFFF